MIKTLESLGLKVFTSLFDELVVVDNGKEGFYFDNITLAYNAFVK